MKNQGNSYFPEDDHNVVLIKWTISQRPTENGRTLTIRTEHRLGLLGVGGGVLKPVLRARLPRWVLNSKTNTETLALVLLYHSLNMFACLFTFFIILDEFFLFGVKIISLSFSRVKLKVGWKWEIPRKPTWPPTSRGRIPLSFDFRATTELFCFSHNAFRFTLGSFAFAKEMRFLEKKGPFGAWNCKDILSAYFPYCFVSAKST